MLPEALFKLASKHPELFRALVSAAQSALRSRTPWKAVVLSILRQAAPHLASGIADELIKRMK